MKIDKLQLFVVSSGAVFTIVGIAKIVAANGSVKALTVTDPIVGVSLRHLLLAIGLIELLIAVVCLYNRRSTASVALVGSLATALFVYRSELWWLGAKEPCSCLGSLTETLKIEPQTADTIMKLVLAYLLIGSYTLLFLKWRQNIALKKV